MSARVLVTGIGLVSPAAEDAAGLHAAVCSGRHAGGRQSQLAVDGMPGPLAAPHAAFDAKAELGRENLRPLDRTGRLAAAAARRALADSGWTADDLARHEVGLVLGTLFGSVQTISAFDRRSVTAGPSYAKPMDFANSVINAAAGQAGIRFNLRGVNATVSGDLTAGVQALGLAADLIRAGRADALLAGGADELCVEALYGFHKLGLLCPEGIDRALPLTAEATGLMPAEGAALLMLESEASAARRGARVLAELRGHGSTMDVGRGREAAGGGAAIAAATRAALTDAGLAAEAVHCASLGANGSPADRWELAGVTSVVPRPRKTAVKVATGEALGGSGALQAVLAIESLRRGECATLPRDGSPSPPTEPMDGDTALITALGLQGRAAALVVGSVDSETAS